MDFGGKTKFTVNKLFQATKAPAPTSCPPPDTTPPAIVRSTIEKTAGGGAGYIKQGGSYYAYAQVDDPSSGLQAVQADVQHVLSTGQTSVAMSSAGGPWMVDGQSYNYRTALLTADGSVSEGSKAYQITATDNSYNSAGPTDFNVTVDNTGPAISSTVINKTSGYSAGYVKQGGAYQSYANVTRRGERCCRASRPTTTTSARATRRSRWLPARTRPRASPTTGARRPQTANSPLSEGSKAVHGQRHRQRRQQLEPGRLGDGGQHRARRPRHPGLQQGRRHRRQDGDRRFDRVLLQRRDRSRQHPVRLDGIVDQRGREGDRRCRQRHARGLELDQHDQAQPARQRCGAAGQLRRHRQDLRRKRHGVVDGRCRSSPATR